MKKISTGPAFGDFIGLEKSSPKRHYGGEGDRTQMRDFLLPLLLIILLGILIFRLAALQIFQGSYYRNLADNNRIRTTTIHAPRGIIFDRNNTPLVFNVPGFREIINGKTILLSQKQAIQVIAEGKKDLEVDSLREYSYKDAFSHVLGYLGQISQGELKKEEFKDYAGGDLIGKDGIEQQYESLLKGTDGKQLFEVDALGKTIRTLGVEDPIPGLDIKLTLDAKLQIAGFKAMENVKKGALIVSTPKGEILALISKPSFDPNLFTKGEYYSSASDSAKQNLSDVLLGQENPLLNRAISGVYPPGSTFKIITAAAALEDKIIDENFTVEDIGVLQVGAFSFGNWYFLQYGKTEGILNVVSALRRSNDIFFYKLAEKIGLEKLSEMAKNFGLGQALGIDLSGEAEGLVPSDSWKQKAIGESWYLGDTYHYGIGQGYLLTTPLQVNTWTQAIANVGSLYEPHLLQNQKFSRSETKFKIQSSKFLSQKTVDLIRQGMVESCSPGGVAWPLFEFRIKNQELRIDGKNFLEVPTSSTSGQMKDYRQISIACKTGTAQHGGLETMPHAWITLFAPAYDPQIVVTVLSEESGEGSNVAAPIAKKVLEEWFTR
ncbi:MAG: penicillin-binding transpeptidase domain-containing protein [Candidatus Levyibacteriota bacterium]